MTAFLYALLLTATPASAAPLSFECESYSGKLTLSLETAGSSLRADVLRSTETGDFALRAPQTLILSPAYAPSAGWLAWAGVSDRGQKIALSAPSEKFTQGASFTARATVSADWTDTMEISRQLNCRAK